MPPVVQRKPTLRVERALQRDGYRLLAGMDEVGRGALAGPVTVGVVVIDETCRSAPQGVRDSKLLQPHVREAMVPRIRRWAHAHAVGHASPAEIDAIGIIAALRLAGRRALSQLAVVPDLVILDGNHDWLTEPDQVGLLAFSSDVSTDGTSDGASEVASEVASGVGPDGVSETAPDRASELAPGGASAVAPASALPGPPVTTMIKADLKCSSVASASVLAKVARDKIMVELAGEHTAYGWELNKGYAAPEHLGALREHGPSALHRRSWRLPGAVFADAMSDDVRSGPEDAVSVARAAEPDAPTLIPSEPTYDEGHR